MERKMRVTLLSCWEGNLPEKGRLGVSLPSKENGRATTRSVRVFW